MANTQAAKVARLSKARDGLRPPLEDQRVWENRCEEAFTEFRIGVIHLQKDMDALDELTDKEMVWRFLRKLSRERNSLWKRCEEVLIILMARDEWVKAFVDDPDADVNDLPAGIIDAFDARCKQVGGGDRDGEGGFVTVTLAIVGCGVSARQHCATIAKHNARKEGVVFKVGLLVDADLARAGAIKSSSEGAQLCAQAEVVVSLEAARTPFGAAVVLAQNSEKERVITLLIARGVTVLVEPPLADSPAAALRLAALAQTTAPLLKLLVAETGEYWPDAAAELGEELGRGGGRFGASLAVEGRASALDSGSSSCIVAPGLQWVRVAQRLLGPVHEVSSVEPPPQASAHPGCERALLCLMRHRCGATSSLSLRLQDGSGSLPQPHLVVSGSVSELRVPLGGLDTANAQIYRLLSSRLRAEIVSPDSPGAPSPPSPSAWSHKHLLEALAHSVDAHLADLAVAHALRAGVASRRFEAVRPLQEVA